MNRRSQPYFKEWLRPYQDYSFSQGFTLVELLVAVLIIGILSAIAIPSYVAAVDKFHYGKAKMQMGCLKRELEGFRMEKGYFPADVSRNTVPQGIDCFYRQNTNQIPYDSVYDYENWISNSECLIQITFLGKNLQKDITNAITYREPGFYEYKDDLVLSLGIQPLEVCLP